MTVATANRGVILHPVASAGFAILSELDLKRTRFAVKMLRPQKLLDAMIVAPFFKTGFLLLGQNFKAFN